MPTVNLTKIRAQVKTARGAISSIEKLLNKTTPEAVRGDLEMLLQRANQDLEWALTSLRKSEVDDTFRKRYQPGGE